MSRAGLPIGVFDSGVGGLTVVRALLDLAPHEPILYYGDTARVPYGTKSPETVARYSREIARFLADRGVKMIVVACNTASAVALDAVRETFDGPVVGVLEPGSRAAVQAARALRDRPPYRVGVIGTRATIGSGSYPRCIRALDPEIEVLSAACPLFVPLAEENWAGREVTRQVAHTYLDPLLAQGIAALILGCTHYPLLAEDIQAVAGADVCLVSSAEETARTVVAQLAERGLAALAGREAAHVYYASDDVDGFRGFHQRIVGNRNAEFTLAQTDV